MLYHPGSGCRKLKETPALPTTSKINWIGYRVIASFKKHQRDQNTKKVKLILESKDPLIDYNRPTVAVIPDGALEKEDRP